MAEKVELDVKLTEAVDVARRGYETLSNKKVFTGDKGSAALTKVEGNLKVVNDLLAKGKLTEIELGQLRNALRNVFDVLTTYSKELGYVSKETERLSKSLETARKTLDEYKNKQATLKQERRDNIKTASEKIKDYKIESVDSRGGKHRLSDINTIVDKYENNQALRVTDKNGKTYEGNDARKILEDSLKPIADVDKELNKLAISISKTESAVKGLITQLNTSIDADKTHGGGEGAQLIQDFTNARSDAESAIGRELDKKQAADDANALADANIRLNDATQKQTSSLGKAFKQFSIYAIALRTTKKALRDAVKTVKDLDKYLTEQAMVTGRTRQETYKLLKSYQDLAMATGATTKEVAEVATQFMRQGKTAKEALTLTEAAVKAAKVASISATDSVNYLTTALNGFQLSANDAMMVSDKFASVAAQSATSYEEIAIALSKVASQANLAGMSIDYTTALLAKGIETTREAPETIGTALKTVIARMRELTDYGETLEGDTDVNNVETQLGYIGIALRKETGELRSTEEVLDELGRKWDTLNSNQQAAVAKALAGTRQQSRLIAMMSDYERTIELQEIAQRSAGATAAQAATYMEGMEAALNKVNVAWEKIVTSVTNSDAIIGFINTIADLLDRIGTFLSTDFGTIALLTTVLILGINILGNKLLENRLAKEQNKYQLEQQKIQLKINKLKAQAYIDANKERIQQERITLDRYKSLQALILEKKAKGKISAFDEAILNEANEYIATNEIKVLQDEADLKTAELTLSTYDKQSQMLDKQLGQATLLGSTFGGITSILSTALSILFSIATIWKVITKLKDQSFRQSITQNIKDLTGTLLSGAKAFFQMGPAGIIGGMALLAAAGVGVAAALGAFKDKTEENTADRINELSAEIYKLNEKANALKKVTSAYQDLNNKVIQTVADQEEMNNLLESAADKLTEEEKKKYDSLATNTAKIQYLEELQADTIEKANNKRWEQVETLKALNKQQRENILLNKDNSDYLQVQDAVLAINNNTLYEYIDSLDGVKDGVESFTQSVLEGLNALEAYEYATQKDGHSIKQLTNVINNASTVLDGKDIAFAEILTSDDYSFSQKINAYEELTKAISELGDPALTKAFKDTYQQWENLNSTFENTIDYIDKLGISINEINDMAAAIQKLGYNAQESANKLNDMFERLEAGASLESTIKTLFADDLKQYDYGSDEWKAVYNRILNAYQVAVGQGTLNMGQNLTKLTNQINSFYDKASKWSSMTEQEKTEFMQDNYKMFEGEQGKKLYQAFETGNYNDIQKALANNEALKETIRLRLQELQIDLDIEKARRTTGEANEAYIAELEKNIKALKDYESETSKIYQASLELRLNQEKSQLDIYRDYLKKQQDALTESLDKRKEAYQKYFDAVNQEKEDEDYEEQANLLIGNLQKLSSSTDANSMQQTKELEKQLEDLEKERLQTLRERAQEAVLQNMDDQVTQINEKFDKLLENNQALLNAMMTESGTSDFVANALSTNLLGKSALEAESYIDDFKAAYGSILPSSALENISVRGEGDKLILNIAGKEIQIGESVQQDLYSVIMNALKQQGLR